ncbi:MAG TPA: glutamate synthase subunit beta [Casimicrobiaceae bacterium]|jgi:glutamate synthase (NADPH/NADH) small chain|nr:glutamate synthase subunit beta [Casimicrobiaceae bacterium]
MGKITGFMELERVREVWLPVEERVRNYREFILTLKDEDAAKQGARCMDCGIPFCQSGCPIHNIIPDWNDLVYRHQWRQALDVLHSTNNFPEFTGRVCPAPCEAACTLNINDDPVGIKSIEHFIIDRGWEEGWVVPQPPVARTGKRVAVVGSGPAGMACAQQLARAGHDVVLFEKTDRIGGLLRYGIPDFKMEKYHIDRRVEQMRAEGVEFRAGVHVGGHGADGVSALELLGAFDAVAITAGAEHPRDLDVPGRELEGIHFAMDFLPLQNRRVAGDADVPPLTAHGKHVVVIGGGDTGSDCVGTSNRQGAASIMQFELLAQPPEHENKPLVWPYWPMKLRTSSSHEEGCQRDWAVQTKAFKGEGGKVKALSACRVDWKDGKLRDVPESEFELKADLVLFAMGYLHPVHEGMLDELGVKYDARGNVAADTESYQTSVPKVFAAGDTRRGQSLIVWAIREGRQCARAVDEFLVGSSELPR